MNEDRPVVIIIEDEKQIRRFVRSALEDEGCRVIEAEKGKPALIEIGERKPDQVILDLGLPDMDGINFIKELRAWSKVPILILSARSEENEKIAALDAGADDYLTKPFGVRELLARMRALLRRQTGNHNNNPVLSFGDIEIDFSRHTVKRNGEALHLTQIEYRLLGTLVANAGKVLTHRFLLREVWGPSFVESNHYLRIYVGHLRQKLEADPAQPRHILTEIGVGYRFQF